MKSRNVERFYWHEFRFSNIIRSLLKREAFLLTDFPVVCDCCGKPTQIYYQRPFYAIETVENLGPACISSGRAAPKYDDEFQDESFLDSLDGDVNNLDKLDELVHRTPGYHGWQQEYWRTHCGNHCAFVGYIEYRECKQKGILNEILRDFI